MKVKPTYQELENRIKELNLKIAKDVVEEQEEREEKLLSQLFENMEEGFALHEMIYDNDGGFKDFRFLKINKAFEKLKGLVASNIIGKTAKKVMPKIEQKWIDIYGKVAKTGKPFYFESYAEELGKYFNVSAYSPQKDFFVTIFLDITKQKRLEIESNKLSAAVEQSSNTVVITDSKGAIEYINPSFTKISGYSLEEVLGKNPRILNSGKQPKEYYADMWKTISTGKIWNGEFLNKAKNGKLFWEDVTISPIKNDAGEIINYLAIKKDISTLKENKKKLIEQNEELGLLSSELSEKNRLLFDNKNKFKNLFDKSPVSIWEQDFSETIALLNKKKAETGDIETYLNENPEFVTKCVSKIKILSVNDITLELIGVKNVEELTSHIRKTNTKKAINVLKNELISIAKGKKDYFGETEFRRTDGTILHTIVKSTMIDDNGNNIASIINITEIKKGKEELISLNTAIEKSDELYRLVVAATNLGIWDWNVKEDTIYFSKLWKAQIGYKENELENKFSTWKNLLHPEDYNDANKGVEDYLKNPVGQYISEFRLRCKDGSYIWIYARAEALKNKEGEVVRMFGSHSDISEMKISELKLKKQNIELIRAKDKAEESDKLKTEFINNMSHEIRTPMNGIMGFSDMLSDNDISDEKRANFIKIIQSSGQQLLNIIDDILEISRLGTKQVKVIESDVCLNDVMLALFSTFDIKAKEQKTPLYIKKTLSDTQSTIRTDKTKLTKVLSNLLENALKFTNEGFIEFGYQLKKDNIELYVKDTGIGIEKSKHESIFERFSQAEKELSKNVGGLGLGLSIAKENAELLGGSIQLESKEGKGSTFFLTIPYKPVYKVNDIEKAKTVPKYTILIAEDEEVNHIYLETLLKDVIGLDCKIIHVTNGKDAIEACKENKTIDLVLMDLKMPVMNGFEATKLIKKLRPNLSVVAQTAYSTVQEKEQAILVGCTDFISKPIGQESFKSILDKYLIIK